MKTLIGLIERFPVLAAAMRRFIWYSPGEVRMESWRLGHLHRGRIVEGARQELAKSDTSPARAVLLRLVIHRQQKMETALETLKSKHRQQE
ncbi:hypothetical protein [Caulobacter hibisci]|uniref:Uncharacterized protein n=1 Tax=Caulobacter hibisci TaxID=2035993 RepID=A0ABS0SU48_9CAUL|nr:hypothetical protein [Caulobacter hibisci]MBI1682896.1 hypothetical protein [Caulobacter hibisci]